jgi:hypothetical protein
MKREAIASRQKGQETYALANEHLPNRPSVTHELKVSFPTLFRNANEFNKRKRKKNFIIKKKTKYKELDHSLHLRPFPSCSIKVDDDILFTFPFFIHLNLFRRLSSSYFFSPIPLFFLPVGFVYILLLFWD